MIQSVRRIWRCLGGLFTPIGISFSTRTQQDFAVLDDPDYAGHYKDSSGLDHSCQVITVTSSVLLHLQRSCWEHCNWDMPLLLVASCS